MDGKVKVSKIQPFCETTLQPLYESRIEAKNNIVIDFSIADRDRFLSRLF